MPLNLHSLDAVTAEQLLVQGGTEAQKGKNRRRCLAQYDNRLMLPKDRFSLRGQAPTIYQQEWQQPIDSLEGLLSYLEKRKGSPAVWAEMAGGLAIAMRTLKAQGSNALMINVDLFETLPEEAAAEFRRKVKDVEEVDLDRTDTKPQFIQADITNVELPAAPDLITSVEALQYLDNPLQALCHWYNQLADEGVMVVYSNDFNDWIQSTDEPSQPFEQWLTALKKANIPLSSHNSNFEDCTPIRTRLTVLKKPSTTLRLTAPLVKVDPKEDHYKISYYDTLNGVVEVQET